MDCFFSFSSTSTGQSHLNNGTTCQDSSYNLNDDDYILAIVSDGHGSSNFIRSDKGSKYACEETAKAVKEFVSSIKIDYFINEEERNNRIIQLCKSILVNWYEKIAEDYNNCPFGEDELKNVSDKYKNLYFSGESIEHAYGATLVFALLTKDFFLAVQDGDGSCLVLSEDGDLINPIPVDEKCEASFTTSLCNENAIQDFRFFWTSTIPIAAFLSSDGVENSYPRYEDFINFHLNVIDNFIKHGPDETKTSIDEFLPNLTEAGSGDDVSLAGIVNLDLVSDLSEKIENKINEIVQKKEALKKLLEKRKLEKEIILIKRKVNDIYSKISSLKNQEKDIEELNIEDEKSYNDTLLEEIENLKVVLEEKAATIEKINKELLLEQSL